MNDLLLFSSLSLIFFILRLNLGQKQTFFGERGKIKVSFLNREGENEEERICKLRKFLIRKDVSLVLLGEYGI